MTPPPNSAVAAKNAVEEEVVVTTTTTTTTRTTAQEEEGGCVSHHHRHQQQHPRDNLLLVLGQTRCRDAAGYLATVIFDGNVVVTSNNKKKNKDGPQQLVRRYLGVVWDDPSRGRHNGSLVDPTTGHLVQYFVTNHPTSGSFVLPHKLNFGQPLSCHVLMERYPRQPQEWVQQHVHCAGNRDASKPIEFVGNDQIVKQQQLETLETVSLRFLGLNRIPDQSTTSCPVPMEEDWYFGRLLGACCKHMDLAGNLLTDWMDLKRLLCALPQLEHVSVAHNRFVDSTLLLQTDGGRSEEEEQDASGVGATAQEEESTTTTVWSTSLKKLNLRKCNIASTRTLIALGRVLPNLESLCCAFAHFGDLDECVANMKQQSKNNSKNHVFVPPFARVSELDVTSCGLTKEQLPPLSLLFPTVSDLNLSDNAIDEWPAQVFAHLTHLQWTLTLPSSVESPSELPAKLKTSLQPLVSHHGERLVSLRLDTHPHAQSSIPTGWKLQLFACLGRLECWNSSVVSAPIRADAEKYYLRMYHTQSRNPANTVLLQNPRLEEVLALHPQFRAPPPTTTTGHPACVGLDASGDTAFSMALVTVELRSLCAHSCERPPIVRQLPRSLTVGRLKALLSKHYDLDVDLQALSWVAPTTTIGHTAEASFGNSRETTVQWRREMAMPLDADDDETTTLEDCGLVHGAIVFMTEREMKKHPNREWADRIRIQEQELEQLEQRKRSVAGGGGGRVPRRVPAVL